MILQEKKVPATVKNSYYNTSDVVSKKGNDVNTEAINILYIWLNICWIIGWPIIVVGIMLLIKRNTIRKAPFFIVGILSCYAILALFELSFRPLLSGPLKKYLVTDYYHQIGWMLFGSNIFKLSISFIMLHFISKWRKIAK